MVSTPFITVLTSGAKVEPGAGHVETFTLTTRGRKNITVVPDISSEGVGHSYVDSAALTFPVTIVAGTNDQFEFNEVEYVIAAGVYATAAALATAVTAAAQLNSYVTSANPTLPLTITAASNDQIEYNELEYIIPAGTYATIGALATAVQAATNDEDNVGVAFASVVTVAVDPNGTGLRFSTNTVGNADNALAFGTGAENSGLTAIGLTDAWAIDHTFASPAAVAFNTLVLVTAGDATHIRSSAVPSGIDTLAYGTGAAKDVLATLGLTDGWTIAHTQAAGADSSGSITVAVNGVDSVSGKTWLLLQGAAITADDTPTPLRVGPGLVAVSNAVANDVLPDKVQATVTHNTDNTITYSLAAQLAD